MPLSLASYTLLWIVLSLASLPFPQIQSLIVEPFVRQAKFFPLGVQVVGAIKAATGSTSGNGGGGGSVFWWKLVLMPILHSIGNPMLSEKSLQVLMRRLSGKNQAFMKPLTENQIKNKVSKKNKKIKNDKQSDYQLEKYKEIKRSNIQDRHTYENKTTVTPINGWLELRKEYVTYLQNGSLFVFKQTLSPQQKETNTEPGAPSGGGEDSSMKKKTTKQSHIPIFHAPEGCVLPLPPLAQVMDYLQTHHGKDQTSCKEDSLKSEPVQWGPWRICVNIRPTILDNNDQVEGHQVQCDVVQGTLSMAGSPTAWLQATKAKKQCQLLPIKKFPCLATPLLGEVPNKSNGDKDDGAAGASSLPISSFCDMKVLMSGQFSYSMLMPLTTFEDDQDVSLFEQREWEWNLCLSPTAKLPPLQLLDQNLRRLIPVVAPVPVVEPTSSSTSSSITSLYCVVDIEYEFTD